MSEQKIKKQIEYKTESAIFEKPEVSVINPVMQSDNKLLYSLNFNMTSQPYYPSMDPNAMVSFNIYFVIGWRN